MRSIAALSLILVAAACTDPGVSEPSLEGLEPSLATVSVEDLEAELYEAMEVANARLAADGAEFRIASVEWMGNGTMGREVVFDDYGNTHSGRDFVPHDPRRAPWSGEPGGSNDNITWAVDETGDANPPSPYIDAAGAVAAMTRAVETWDAQTCSNLDLTQNPSDGVDIGLWAAQRGTGGSFNVLADIQIAGFRDFNFPGTILGFAPTFIWVDASNNPTDIDSDGRLDVAFREVYLDPSWAWRDGRNVDVESVTLHEFGHGLSQLHFGAAFFTGLDQGNPEVHFAPLTVMNAGYSGVLNELTGNDIGGHCEIWGEWPMR